MQAGMGPCGEPHFATALRTPDLALADASSIHPPVAVTSTNRALLTEPNNVMPANAASRSKSGTPSSRYRVGRRNEIGASIVRPADHVRRRSRATVPATLTTSPPLTGSQAPSTDRAI